MNIKWPLYLLFLVLLFTGCSDEWEPKNLFITVPGGEVDRNGNGLSAPTGVNASDGDYTDRIIISWDSISVADRYEVYRSTSPEGDYNYIAELLGTSYEDWFLPEGGTYYYYKIIAIYNDRKSDFSIWVSGYQKLSAPDSVDATDGWSGDRIIINWNYVPGAYYYEVYRSTSSGGPYGQIGDTWDTGDTSYTDLVSSGQTYYYKIKSVSIDPASVSDLSTFWDFGWTF